MSLSTILHDISGLSTIGLVSTLTYDLSGNLALLSTIIHDISGFVYPNLIVSSIIQDLSGVSPTILSIDDLLNSHEVIVTKEMADRAAVSSFTNPSIEGLKPQLYKWASAGFPGGYPVNTLTLVPPSVGSDGNSRSLLVYFEYLLGSTTETWLQGLEAITQGMNFTFSHDGVSTITLHVSRT
jgi:hypothetical protein